MIPRPVPRIANLAARRRDEGEHINARNHADEERARAYRNGIACLWLLSLVLTAGLFYWIGTGAARP